MVSTYSEAGVDIDASEKATEALIAQIKNVGRKGDGEAIKLDNGFAGLVKLGDGALAMCTDGVGSKLLLAEEMDSLHTVGIDCVAMNTNDLICVGAEPLSFVDYVALDKPDEELMAKLGKGLAEGCKQSNCTLSGGETAILPELVHGFDIAGTSVGYVKQDEIIDGTKIAEGDVLIGLKSSGPHSNGYTLIRKLFNGDKEIGKQLAKGSAFLYIREDKRSEINPLSISHGFSVEGNTNEKIRLEFDWTGTQDITPWLCIPKSIEHINSLVKGGWAEIMEHNTNLAIEARNIILEVLETPKLCPDSMIVGLSAVVLPGEGVATKTVLEPDPLHTLLYEKYKIQVPVFSWPHHNRRYLRTASYLYNSLEEYEYLAEVLKKEI